MFVQNRDKKINLSRLNSTTAASGWCAADLGLKPACRAPVLNYVVLGGLLSSPGGWIQRDKGLRTDNTFAKESARAWVGGRVGGCICMRCIMSTQKYKVRPNISDREESYNFVTYFSPSNRNRRKWVSKIHYTTLPVGSKSQKYLEEDEQRHVPRFNKSTPRFHFHMQCNVSLAELIGR